MSLLVLLNNREKAVVIWLFIIFLGLLVNKDIRASMLQLPKVFLVKQIMVPFILILAYVAAEVICLHKIGFWNVSMLKDTVVWFLGTAFVLFININEPSKDGRYFKKVLLDNLKISVILEFLANAYTFSLWAELIILPIITFIAILSSVAGLKKETLQAKKIMDFLLAIAGFYLLSYVLYRVTTDLHGFATQENLRSFLLPPILTIAYLPAIYLLAVYSGYELLFVQINMSLRDDKKLANFAKRKVLRTCLGSLGKVTSISKGLTMKLRRTKDRADITNIILDFSTSSHRRE
jgi:hypothetical protein